MTLVFLEVQPNQHIELRQVSNPQFLWQSFFSASSGTLEEGPALTRCSHFGSRSAEGPASLTSAPSPHPPA